MSPSRFIGNLLILFFLCLCFCNCSYKEGTLSSDEICSPVKDRKLSIKKDSQSGRIIRKTRSFDNWSGVKEFKCNYEMKSSSGDGIIAVIQNLVFRRHEHGECIDYVKFTAKNGEESERFCGKVSAFKHSPDDSDKYSFIDPKGDMDTHIYVANTRLMPHENLELEIVYTSYRECKYGQELYKDCGINSRDICIWAGFFGDNVVNCPKDCFDEDSCYKPDGDTISSKNVGTKVTVGAVATIILAFILFVTCLWIMRRHKKLCWSDDCSGPRPSPPSARVEMHPHLQEDDSRSRPAPSAPSRDGGSITVSEDKDLPPSYESLFPAR